MKNNSDYSYFDKMFHRIVLNNPILLNSIFDLDNFLNKSDNNNLRAPVYITGLARSGTTILLNVLYKTGLFSSLTYQDMPFVMAPYFWSRISKKKNIFLEKERAHGDRIKVGLYSPEALEEVFWKVKLGKAYIKKDHLQIPDLSEEEENILMRDYKKYVRNIINKDGEKEKIYLAKNNNHLLKIKLIKKIFPEAKIITPVRHPFDYACSLLNQHKRFVFMQKQDPFVLEYMNWLGHYEFGNNFKYFYFGEKKMFFSQEDLLDIKFWLKYWTLTHQYLLQNHREDLIFIGYEDLCHDPQTALSALAEKIKIDPKIILKNKDMIQSKTIYEKQVSLIDLETEKVYEEIKYFFVNKK